MLIGSTKKQTGPINVGLSFYQRNEIPFLIVASSIINASLSLGLLWGTLNTIQSHANTLTNMFGVFQVALNWTSGQQTKALQKAGIFVAMCGAGLMILDP